jgi:hypothetical protein
VTCVTVLCPLITSAGSINTANGTGATRLSGRIGGLATKSPADLPVQKTTKIEFVINLKTGKLAVLALMVTFTTAAKIANH